MSDLNELFKATAEGIFSDTCTKALLDSAEKGSWPADAWEEIEKLGLTSAIDVESNTLLSLETLSVIIRAAGEYHVPLPLAETLLAQRALFRCGRDASSGPLTVAPPRLTQLPTIKKRDGGNWTISGDLHKVPWGRHAVSIIFLAKCDQDLKLVMLPGMPPTTEGKNLAGEPRDDYRFDNLVIEDALISTIPQSDAERLQLEGALFRSLQMVGAMSRILNQTVQYSRERMQFGRPIAKFQAVQHQVAFMATQIAASTAATEAAISALESELSHFEVYAAKGRTSESAGICCNVGHQVHGAIGFTHEHSLHLSSRRLMSWRDEYGSESECYEWIGTSIQSVGGTGLWSFITTPRHSEDNSRLTA